MAERNSKRRDSILTLYQQKQRHPTLCPLCNRAFFGLKLLPGCQHAYCSTCIRSTVNKNNASCKVCSHPIDIQPGDIDQLPTDEYFETLVKSADNHRQEWPQTPIDTKPVRCSLCPDDEAMGGNNNSMASSWCGQCLQYMCERCLGVHAKGSTTKQHKVDALRDVAVRQTVTTTPDGVATPKMNLLNNCVSDCEAQLQKRQELRRRLDVVRKQIDDESNDLQQLINRNRDEVIAELEKLAETETAQHVGRHLMILKCFVQYCVGEHAGEIDERIDEAVDKLKDVNGDNGPLPIAIARSLLLDKIIEVSLVRTCARKYLPQHVGDNLIGKLAVGLAAADEGFMYQTWDEQASEIVNLKEQINNLQETLIEAARRESEIRNALTSKINLIEKLEQDLVSSNAYGRQVEENLQRSVAQVSDLKADVSKLLTERSELQSQVQQLNEDKRGLIIVQQRSAETEAKLNDEVSRMKQANAKLVEDRDTLKKARDTLEASVKAKDVELKESKGQEQQLLAEIKQDRVRESELRSKLKQTEELQIQSQQLAQAAEQRFHELEAKFENQLTKSKQTEDELNRSLLEANKANNNLQQRIGELINEVDQMQTETFASLKAAQQRTAEVEEQVRFAAEKEIVLQQQLDMQRQREDELNQQLQQAEEKERSQELRVHELQKQVQQIADERIGLRAVPAFELNGIGAVHGVTSVDNEVYVVRANSSNIEVYAADSYILQRRLVVKALIDAIDMTSCGRYRCLYVADCTGAVVHRIEISRLRDVVPTSWEVRDRPYGLSVTPLEGHVLVACRDANRLKQFTTLGQLVRDISLEPSVAGPRHAVQLSSGQFVVVHTGRPDVTDRVSIITSDGRHVTVSYSGYLLNYPTHVAVDRRHGFIYVPDYSNRRVVVLNRDLIQVGEVGGTLRGVWAPRCVWFDSECRRLYVAECGGRIIVYDISHHPTSRSLGSSSCRTSGFAAVDDNNSVVDL